VIKWMGKIIINWMVTDIWIYIIMKLFSGLAFT
jgi:hypothetical protein